MVCLRSRHKLDAGKHTLRVNVGVSTGSYRFARAAALGSYLRYQLTVLSFFSAADHFSCRNPQSEALSALPLFLPYTMSRWGKQSHLLVNVGVVKMSDRSTFGE